MSNASLAPLVRLCVSPALIGVASAVAERRGPRAGGWFAALPLTSGPVVLVFALERGSAFAAEASIGILLAVVALALYILVYCQASRRLGWPLSGALACIAYLSVLWPLGRMHVSLPLAFLSACAAVLGTRPFLPKDSQPLRRSRLPVWDIPSRMAIAAALVWTLAELSTVAGPVVSGLLAPFPVVMTIMSTFLHRRDGAAVARRFLSSLLIGLISFAVFFVATGALLQRHGITTAFGVATLGALGTHAMVLARAHADGPPFLEPHALERQ